MSEMEIDLPDEVIAFIEDQVRAGVFASPSEMVVALVEDERARIGSKELGGIVDEATGPDPFPSP